MVNNKFIFSLLVILIVLGSTMVLGHSESDLHNAEKLIEEKTPCNKLNEDQLAMIGDYYMEQMHPGEEHKRMDERMGGEGSERLRLMHLRMADRFYCNSSGMEESAERKDWFDIINWNNILITSLVLFLIIGTIYFYNLKR